MYTHGRPGRFQDRRSRIEIVVHLTTVESPVGPLTIAATAERVCLLHFGPETPAVRRQLERWYPGAAIAHHSDPAGAVTTLNEYFRGNIGVLDGVPVELNGTPFQRQVWTALRRIRAGATASYAGLACELGLPAAVRAVGAANGANPVAVIVPCHRVIGSNGSLTGYGGGLDRKRWLLQHEGVAVGLF
jgi:methylated-DNA-[protein]-cysteine S-methyltransferase